MLIPCLPPVLPKMTCGGGIVPLTNGEGPAECGHRPPPPPRASPTIHLRIAPCLCERVCAFTPKIEMGLKLTNMAKRSQSRRLIINPWFRGLACLADGSHVSLCKLQYHCHCYFRLEVTVTRRGVWEGLTIRVDKAGAPWIQSEPHPPCPSTQLAGKRRPFCCHHVTQTPSAIYFPLMASSAISIKLLLSPSLLGHIRSTVKFIHSR